MTKCAKNDCEELIPENAKHGTKWCSKVACQRKRNNLISTRCKKKNKTGLGTVAGKRKELTKCANDDCEELITPASARS